MEVIPVVKLEWPDLTFGAIHLPTMPKIALYPEITHVAVKYYNGLVVSLPKPNSHSELAELAKLRMTGTYGFIDSLGVFLDRSEAYSLAKINGQLISDTDGPELFSEDLW